MGSGCAGLVAALAAANARARVVVLEKTSLIGGTTAVSGGTMWISANPVAAAEGHSDSIEDALTYLQAGGGSSVNRALLEVFARRGVDALRFIQETTGLEYLLGQDTDYRAELPGGKQIGRSVVPGAFDSAVLGEKAADVRHSDAPLDIAEIYGSVNWHKHAAHFKRPPSVWTRGRALVGALYAACLKQGVVFHKSHRVKRLLVENSRVMGVVADSAGQEVTITAARSVILASGGFEWNAELAKAFLRGPLEAAASPDAMEGDGLKMAMSIGASLGSMTQAWWSPLIQLPGETAARMVVSQRLYPHSIMVNSKGRRFMNEAQNYHDAGAEMLGVNHSRGGREHSPVWLIFDRSYRRRYGIACIGPDADDPSWLVAHADIESLARAHSIDREALTSTVESFNRDARSGRDSQFGRGESTYSLSKGDRAQEGIARTLGPIETPPYYAVRLYAGTIGTCGGPLTDERSRVLDVWNKPIEGLFAAGNVAASPTGSLYPGAGGTLGLAATFGYLAGLNA